ncbi:hypothetical protein [Amycolatopsis sp. NPDC054798]
MSDYDKGADPDRLATAAHEIAHALAFGAAHVSLGEIRVFGRGNGAHGHVTLDGEVRIDKGNARMFAIAHYAGRAGSLRWRETHGMNPYDEHRCATDMKFAREFFREARKEGIPLNTAQSGLRRDADRFVRTHWRIICRLAPVLARAGSLNPNRVPSV